LMLEHGEVLLTWQLLANPVGAGTLPIPATPIADHRKAYLEYEGPLSGDRGEVQRVAVGAVEITDLCASRCEFRLTSARIEGEFVLARGGEGGWRFQPIQTL